ncbi:MAG: hypothetical protein NTV14_01390 [Coprothermobacterota bacterium]|nr:hypothetical protein [Coprothermobacterota bacterium]
MTRWIQPSWSWREAVARKVGVAVDSSTAGRVGAGDGGISGTRVDDEFGAGAGELSTGRDGLGCTIGADGVSDEVAVIGEREEAGDAGLVEEEEGSVGEGIVVQAERRTHARQKTSNTLRVFPFIDSLLLP